MYTLLRAAAFSMKPVKWDKAANADRMEEFFCRAAKLKARLALGPEGVLEGYVANDVIENPALAPRMEEAAEPLDGPSIRRFQRLARRLHISLAFGFAERRRDGIYNCALFISPRGIITGRHHKTQFAEGYHASWRFNRIGRLLRAFDTPYGRAGFLVCNERWNPLIARTLVLDGARFLLIPSFGSRNHQQNENVLARARENGVPIVEANVGMNLIVSLGEIVAYQWGCDRLTVADIQIPVLPSPSAARRWEREYLCEQGPEMRRRYLQTLKKLRTKKRRRKRS
ncbi:MAG: carbon-nitrogen hydrolase family protein [Planctomycetes bacterium]|nr:carbon-nitrogen hydrolase family protein [Planctomycetota bacterium]